jgi:hypothetical protein
MNAIAEKIAIPTFKPTLVALLLQKRSKIDSPSKRFSLLPACYFLLTFILPAELRSLAWRHQRVVYDQLMQCSWAALKQFSHNAE